MGGRVIVVMLLESLERGLGVISVSALRILKLLSDEIELKVGILIFSLDINGVSFLYSVVVDSCGVE